MNPKAPPVTAEAKQWEVQSVRKVHAGELREVAAMLARSFYDDPVARWFVPDDDRRLMVVERAFHFYLRKLWFPQGECLTTAGVVGAATWLPPGGWEVSLVRQIQLLPGMALALGRSLGRALRGIAAMESNHPKEHHFYLPYAGVDPQWQGKGIGSTLLVPVLRRCDRESIPAYLESTSPINRRLYERHGFEVTKEFRLGEGSPPLWCMWRKPKSQ
ncbi:MAG: hypothetical protein DDT26_00984 [Dehalococcoidia bacterium]|nr:hypothetical protein [Chloroflexota bacterium]